MSIDATKEIELETIEELMRLTVDAKSFDDLANLIVEKCAILLKSQLCTVWRRINEGGQDKLVLGGSEGFTRQPGEINPIYILNWDANDDKEIEGVTAWIAIRQSAYLVNNFPELSNHPSHKGRWDAMQWDAQAILKFSTCLASRGAFEVWEHPGESAGPFIFKGSLFVNAGKTAILGQFASPRGVRLTKIKGPFGLFGRTLPVKTYRAGVVAPVRA